MAEFFEKIPNGMPKLPENYWETQDCADQSPDITIFDNNLKASMNEIIFRQKEI